MYDITKAVIESKNYELSDMLRKIDVLWMQGSLTDEQRNELIELARSNANIQNSVDIMAKLEEHERRIKALEDGKSNDSESTEEYPEYVAGKWYYAGDKVSFDGKNYECIAPSGAVCTWSPADYPTYWKEV